MISNIVVEAPTLEVAFVKAMAQLEDEIAKAYLERGPDDCYGGAYVLVLDSVRRRYEPWSTPEYPDETTWHFIARRG